VSGRKDNSHPFAGMTRIRFDGSGGYANLSRWALSGEVVAGSPPGKRPLWWRAFEPLAETAR